MEHKDIFDLITTEKIAYTKGIELEDGWNWSMQQHIRRSYLYKHSQFLEHNENRDLRPNKNIVRPILNVQYRTEGFDVKDIELYVDDPEIYFKSFLVDKFYNDWALDNGLDTFIDELVQSYVDYGGVLVRETNESRPEVIDLKTIAFCNQADILSAPFAIRHRMTPSQLRKMKKSGWGEKGATMTVDEFIYLCKQEEGKKDMEIFEVQGEMPKYWLEGEDEDDVPQVQIVSFYKDKEGKDKGVTLFKSKQSKLPFKFLKRDAVQGRALGFGGVEELFDAQEWTNFSEATIAEILEFASKAFFKTTDQRFKTRNNISYADNGEIFTLAPNTDLAQIDNSPRNLAIFNDSVERWEAHAGRMGAASEGLLGEEPSSGTPFKLFEAQNIEAKGMHRFRQGQIAVFVDEIHREWILPHIAREITKEKSFLSELSFEDIQKVSNQLIAKQVFNFQKEKILSGKLIAQEDIQKEQLKIQEKLKAKGNKQFIKILKDELKDVPIKVKTNIANKQKNLALLTDKLVNVMRQFIATPEIRQDPGMNSLLNTILESSGMSPIMFGSPIVQQTQPQQGGGQTGPLQSFGEANREGQQNEINRR